MGSCVSSSTKDPDAADIKFKPSSFGSKKTDKLVNPNPIKDRPSTNGALGDFGSKEENYFDSQAWLDSDCDDDFLSVDGEFAPSHGNTPVHHTSASGPPRVNKALFEDPAPYARPEPSPKRRLSDLFQQSLQVDREDASQQNTSVNVNEANAPYPSGVQSSERTPNGNLKADRDKLVNSLHCCIPSLISSRSFSERKKKMSPPGYSIA